MSGGIVNITLGGASYSMKPTYGAMREIETRTDMTVSELLELVLAQRLKFYEATLIIFFACNAAGEDFNSVEAVGDLVFAAKLTNPVMMRTLAEFLTNCLYAPDEAKKKFEELVVPILSAMETG